MINCSVHILKRFLSFWKFSRTQPDIMFAALVQEAVQKILHLLWNEEK